MSIKSEEKDYTFTIKHFPKKETEIFRPFALGRMNFTFGLDYKIDDFKKVMGYLKNAPLLFYPYFLTQPAFAAGLDDLSMNDAATGGQASKTAKKAFVTAQELYGQLGAPPGSAAEQVANQQLTLLAGGNED